MQEETWTIITWILGLIAILVVVFLLFFGPGKSILINLGLLGGLPKEAEEASKNNFDIMLENLQTCKALTETDCLCEVFPSWPATFAKDYKLTIAATGKTTKLDLAYAKKINKEASINDLIINAKIIENKEPIPLAPVKTIDWKDEPPLFFQSGLGRAGFLTIGKEQYKVISGHVYKGEPNTLYLLISSKPKDKLSQLEPIVSSIKKCAS